MDAEPLNRRSSLLSSAYCSHFCDTSFQILNESLPHLGASLAGHLLGTAWAGFRVSSSKHLQDRYNKFIVHGTCDGIDLLQDWWSLRTRHTV